MLHGVQILSKVSCLEFTVWKMFCCISGTEGEPVVCEWIIVGHESLRVKFVYKSWFFIIVRWVPPHSLSSPQSVSTQETPYNPVAPIIPLLSALLATFSKLFSLGSCQAMKEKLTTMSRELSCLATGPQFNSDLLQVLSNGIDNVKPVTNVVCHLWNANKTPLFSRVLAMMDVESHNGIIHFAPVFLRGLMSYLFMAY